jgi:hypothetical protein
MGERLLQVVEHIRVNSRGVPALDLARLNLRVGKPLSRFAATLPDEPALVASAWAAATEILKDAKGKPR